MLRRGLAVLTLSLLATLPAAALQCSGTGGSVTFSFGFNVGEFSEQERAEFDLMILKRMGVDATRVERWGDCLRAFVRKPEGGEEMQFFNPDTYERVY
ncbi:hypothetical protein PSC71_09385 [Devosia sp. J2-20]|uniref:hypothetical protein n=1 Tax=Devosia sp. J2-20 TaxID=3026161 RepID=UPI00249CC86C|nr:hypothetical protein [Devosia sp. J2-20]WDR00926.1 hypothetical protein PSC71_09385 [Devosia sp. J2-20]